MSYTAEEKAKLLDFVLNLHNRQIAAFMESVGLPKTGTKEVYRENLTEALKQKRVAYADLVALLDQVAPWGKQHVFLYSGRQGDSTPWRKAQVASSLLPDDGEVRGVFAKPRSLVLPEKMTLASIEHTPNRLRVTAVARRDGFFREEALDEERDLPDGRRVEFRAYVKETARGLIAFEWDLMRNVAMMQITQLPSGMDYEEQVQSFAAIVKPWLDLSRFTSLDIKKAIKALHVLAEKGQQEARPQAIHYATQSGRSLFGRGARSHTPLLGEDVIDDALRNVRERGSGQLGNFYWLPESGTPIGEEVHVILVGSAARVDFPTIEGEDVIRHVLERIRHHCK